MSATEYVPGCIVGGGIAICGVGGLSYRTITYCPTCECRRRFVVRWQMWYGDDATCLGCGDSWQDGDLCPRPFRRGWRRERIERAKKQYANAGSYRDFLKASRSYMEAYFAADGAA